MTVADFYEPFDKPEPVTQRNLTPVTASYDVGDYTGYVGKVCDGVAHAVNGTRNHTLNGAAYTLGRIVEAGQLDEATVTVALQSAARAAGLDEVEIGATIASGIAAGRKAPRALDPRVQVPDVTTIETVAGEDLDDTVRRLFPRIDWYALWADQDEEEWIVEPLLPARRLIALYSAPKVGKSLLMLELAASIATGSSVLGVTPDRPRRVLYVDFENDPKADIRERLQAMAYKPDDLERLDYLSFPTLAALDSERGGVELMEAIRVYRSEVVVVDTVSRAVKGEENENDTWLAFYRHTGLRLKQAGIALVRLDHSGKDESKGQRGGSAKMGDVDAVWRLSRVTDDVYRLDCEANRMPVNERTLTLHREQLPRLHHRVDAKGRSAAYEALIAKYIETLDHLGIDKNLGRDKVRALLQEAGHAAKNAPLGEAIKRRKMSVLSVPATAGTGPSEHLSPGLRGQVGTGSDDE